jgi:hypothetical protein
MTQLPLIGWREWVSFPDMGIGRIKCKIDTGARTSSLHATNIEPDHEHKIVQFSVNPFRKRPEFHHECTASLIGFRDVKSSGGQLERRYVIETLFQIGGQQWPIEVTLTDRSTMRFRMLLGRTAMQKHVIIDPAQSYLVRKPG